jgi:hypothetical protein
VQYPGFHSFVALPRWDSSYVTGVTHKFRMSLCRHQDVSKRSSSEAFQEHKPNDWPALYANLKKAQQHWGMLSLILVLDGASPRARGLFYKAVVQAVLLYGCETWVVTNAMLRVLEGFHHEVAQRISGLMPQ